MNYRTDLFRGEGFCIFMFFILPDSGLSVLTVLHFYFWWRDIGNIEYNCIYTFPRLGTLLAARPTERKTAINSFQRLRSPQNSTWTTADNKSMISLCSASDNQRAEGIYYSLTIPVEAHRKTFDRDTQREFCSKPLKHSIVKRILVFKW